MIKLLAWGARGLGFDFPSLSEIGYLLLPSRDMAEIPLKRRKSVIQPTNQRIGNIYAPSFKFLPWVIRFPVRLFVLLSVIPSQLHSNGNIKIWVVIQLPSLDIKFIYRLLTLYWHHISLGMGQGKNVRDFTRFWLYCCWGHSCFTNTSCLF